MFAFSRMSFEDELALMIGDGPESPIAVPPSPAASNPHRVTVPSGLSQVDIRQAFGRRGAKRVDPNDLAETVENNNPDHESESSYDAGEAATEPEPTPPPKTPPPKKAKPVSKGRAQSV